LIEQLEKLTEGLKIDRADKEVIRAFTEKKAKDGKKLTTDGKRLDGQWMGGRGIAEWKDGKIHFDDLGSKAAQTVEKAVRKEAPKNWIAEGVLGEGASPKFIGSNMDRVASYAKEAKVEFRKGNVKLGAMAMADILSELSRVYAQLEDVDGRFGAVTKNIRDAINQSIRFDKELEGDYQ
jgi:hypothetical protein